MTNRSMVTRQGAGAGGRARRFRVSLVGAVVALVVTLVPSIALTPSVSGAAGGSGVSLSPISGPAVGGNVVTITGSGFAGTTGVFFQAQPVKFTVVSDLEVRATAPGDLDGPVTVSLNTPGGGVIAGTYTYGPVASFNVQQDITTSSPYIRAMSPYSVTTGWDGNLWFTYSDPYCQCIGQITPSGALRVFSDTTNTKINTPRGITVGPDHNIWFTNYGNNTIGKIDITTYAITTYSGGGINHPEDIATGPDNNLWFTNYGLSYVPTSGSIGKITTAGVISNYTNSSVHGPWKITAGPRYNGDLWFTNIGGASIGGASIGRILTVDGSITTFTDPSITRPFDITAESGLGTFTGAVYFTNLAQSGSTFSFSIGTIDETVGHGISNLSDPAIQADEAHGGLVVGADNALYFGNGGAIGRVGIGAGSALSGVTSFANSGFGSSVFGLTNGPDGALWFTSPFSSLVGRYNPADVDVPPTVTAVSPGNGVPAGGATVQITGTGFVNNHTTVSFGGTPASVTVNSPTSLTVFAPPGTGTVPISVTTPAGTSAPSSASQFVYGFSIIFPAPQSDLGNVKIGGFFIATITADAGVAPYKYKLTSGKLPTGLKLSTSGDISGTVKAGKKTVPGTYTFTVTATDSTKKTKQTASAQYVLTVVL